MIDIHIIKDSNELQEALKIREDVFVKGQNVPLAREHDGLDESSEHAILYYDNKAAATARIRYIDNKIKLERLAVLDEVRRKGLGREMMDFLIKYGKEKQVNEIYMHAQYYLLDFYKSFGFKQRGDIFYDANIKHIEMYMEMNK